MLTVPLQCSLTHYDLFLILQDENIERLKAYDPAQIDFLRLGKIYTELTLRNMHICYATAEEAGRLASAADLPGVVAQLKQLARGWTFRPEDGDSDGPYQRPGHN